MHSSDPSFDSGEFAEQTVTIDGAVALRVLAPGERLLRSVERAFPRVRALASGNTVRISGHASEVQAAANYLSEIMRAEASGPLEAQDLARGEAAASNGRVLTDVLGEAILQARGKSIRAKTPGQQRYVQNIDEYTITFGIGPAGTGKTYLAMAKAVQMLQRKEVERIILTRPAVEAGERLGFLPGSLTDKIDPYLRPLYDALSEMMDAELVPKLLANGTIEVAPLAYMRGRTLNNSFVILDEAQNTTPEQMKMFLTRLGFGSRMVVTGDITQVDLPNGASGLKLVTRILDSIDDIAFAELTSADVVRHTLVGQIVDAYTKYEATSMITRDAGGRDRGERRAYRTGAPRIRSGHAPSQDADRTEHGRSR